MESSNSEITRAATTAIGVLALLAAAMATPAPARTQEATWEQPGAETGETAIGNGGRPRRCPTPGRRRTARTRRTRATGGGHAR